MESSVSKMKMKNWFLGEGFLSKGLMFFSGHMHINDKASLVKLLIYKSGGFELKPDYSSICFLMKVISNFFSHLRRCMKI